VIPFNEPVRLGSELSRFSEALNENGHVAGGGPFGARCEALLKETLGHPTLLTSSCTHALEMAGLLLDVGPGDEVVVPSFTFVSTANAFALRGATIRFVDVDETGNLDPAEVERELSPRTKVIVAVHYAGNSCDLAALRGVAGRVPIVEDAAQALGATYEGKHLGTFGALAAFSFHETKNVGCGEGGALTVNESGLLDRAEYIRDKGTNRRRFLSGLVDKYTWVDVGSSYVLSDLNAAYLVDQLVRLAEINARRGTVFAEYRARLEGPMRASGGHVILPRPWNAANHHLFALVFRRKEERDGFIGHMKRHGILTPFHYVALHLSPKGREHHRSGRALPWSERLTDCLVRLPLFFNMTDGQVDEVATRALEYLHGL
jgi:dTDP-4-amino-4,6-dideoxygalactose transaminase